MIHALLPFAFAAAMANATPPNACVVLCYHHVDDPAKNEYTVPPADFAAQLDHLKANGFHVVPLAQVVDAYHGKGTLPEKCVAITIDDGWKCANTKALPILKEHGFPATLFIYPAMVGSRGDKSSYADYKQFAQDPLVTIACHSWSHPNLVKDGDKLAGEARDAWLDREYVQSKAKLEKELGLPIKWLAYPYGLYDAQVCGLVKQAGYEAAFSVNGAPNSAKADPMFLNRTMIMKSDGMKGFTRKVAMLPLEIQQQNPPDGSTIKPTHAHFSVKVVDPDVKPESVQIVMGSHKGTYDRETGVASIALDQPLKARVYQIAVTARDAATGKARTASWLVRVKGK